MNNKKLLNSLIKFAFSSTLTCTSLLLVNSPQAKANCQEDFGTNPSIVDDACEITPDRYVITIYEMGFCTSDPLAGSNFSAATCTATFTSEGGSEVNIAGTTVDLSGGQNDRPTVGTYDHAYIKMSNTFGLRGTYRMNDTTFCSTSSGSSETTSGCTGTNFSETLLDFSQGGTCSGSPEYSVSVDFTSGVTGTMKAKLTNDAYVTDTSCGSSTRLVGSFEPTTPITISDTTQGLEVDFTVTNTGMTIVPNGGGNAIASFGSGPFRPRFSAY